MTVDEVVKMCSDALFMIIKLSAPILLISLVIGLVISIFQTVTSIQEQTLTFLPKLIVILLMIALLGGTMFASLSQYTIRIFEMIPQIPR